MRKIVSSILVFYVIVTSFTVVAFAQGVTENEVEALMYANPLSKSADSQGAINSTTNRLSIINEIFKKKCKWSIKSCLKRVNLEASGTFAID